MKTVIQVVQHLRPGGIETLSLDLSSFPDEDEQLYIVSLEGNLEEALQQWPRLNAYKDRIIFLNKQAGFQVSTVINLLKLFKKLQPFAVHTHHIGPLLYAGLAAKLNSVKHLIHTEHDAWHLNDSKHVFLQRWAIKLFQPVLVADANFVKDIMKQVLNYKDVINVIHNGIDTHRFIPGDKTLARAKLHLPGNVQIIGCSGRLEHVKGQKTLIDAVSKLPDKIHLAFAGIGSLDKELRQQSIDLNMDNRVHFLGRIDDMPSFYQSLDVFCLPSLNEGYPLSPLEAQACNIPSLVTEVGGSPETICPLTGQSIPAGDEITMSITLQKMLSNATRIEPRKHVLDGKDVRQMIKAYQYLRYAGE